MRKAWFSHPRMPHVSNQPASPATPATDPPAFLEREDDGHNPRWHEDPAIVADPNYYGVFEGGGAKGVAYLGALEAMLARKLWFGSVAGASSGAITAALIASGATLAQIEEVTDDLLRCIRVKSLFRGLINLSRTGGYFPKTELLATLRTFLSRQVRPTGPEGDPTFLELYETAGIELNVVATDLSTHQLLLFNHRRTASCSVARAVLASLTIPFVFEDSVLQVWDDEHDVHACDKGWHHTVVDGGVWSNFPWFLYTDPFFRQYHQLPALPRKQRTTHIIGFVLDEEVNFTLDVDNGTAFTTLSKRLRRSPVKDTCRFLEPTARDIRLRPREHRHAPPHRPWRESPPRTPSNMLRLSAHRLAQSLAWIVGRWGQAMRWRDMNTFQWWRHLGVPRIERRRWPWHSFPPTGKNIVYFVDGLLSAFRSSLGLLVLAVVFGWGLYSGWNDFHQGQALPVQYAVLIVDTMFFFTAPIFVGLVLIALTSRIFARSLRRLGYGLLMTYVNGTGVVSWLRADPRVMFLPVGGIGMLDFKRLSVTKDAHCPSPSNDAAGLSDRERLIRQARIVTERQLERLLAASRSLHPDDRIMPLMPEIRTDTATPRHDAE